MKPTENETDVCTDGGEPGARPDGSGPVEESEMSDRAAAFHSEADFSMSKGDELREFYDRKFYAPMRILLTDYRGIIGVTVILFYILMGTIGTLVVPRPHQAGPRMLPWFQDMAFPLGTDPSGKSLLRMIVHATPRMLQLMVGGAVFSTAMSIGVGTLAGFKRGMIDRVLMTIADTSLNLPGLPLLIVLVAIFQPTNPFLIGVILSVNSWAGGARSLRAQVLQLRNEDYVEATRAMGISTSRNIQTNVMPSLMPLIMLSMMGALRGIIFAAVGLYFLGILPSSTLNWGQMLNMAYQEVNMSTTSGLHYLLVPMITIAGIGVGTTFLAQAFDRVFNPRLRAKHAKTIIGGGDDDEESADASAKEVMLQ